MDGGSAPPKGQADHVGREVVGDWTATSSFVSDI